MTTLSSQLIQLEEQLFVRGMFYFYRTFAYEIYYYGIYFYDIYFYGSILLRRESTSS
jgi:hypothetical protein